eukprot:gene35786-43405_t
MQSVLRRSSVWRVRNLARPPRRGLVDSATGVAELVNGGGLIGLVQGGLCWVHGITGLPWWSTIALSTAALRVGLLPLVHQQNRVSQKLAKAGPELSMLAQLYRQKVREVATINKAQAGGAVLGLTRSLWKGVRATLVLHEVSVLELLGYPLLNLYVFLLFVFSVRDLVLHGPAALGLEAGGAAWFVDLSEKDGTLLLPLSAVCLSYANIDHALGGGAGKGGVLRLVRDGAQCLLLLSLPLTSTLPAGVFCYWIPNGLATAALAMHRARGGPGPAGGASAGSGKA